MKFAFTLVSFIVSSLLFSACLDTSPTQEISFQEQWVKDTTAIGIYLRSKGIFADKEASGVSFVIDSLASGFPPKSTSKVTFKYTGRLLSETIFDENKLNGMVSTLIPGFQTSLLLLPEGSKGRFYIPSVYAYGSAGISSIPPNANLIFEIQLLDVETTGAQLTQLALDTVLIDNHLASKSINAIRDTTGVRYVITALGTGPKPDLYSKIKLSSTGKLLTSGDVFYSGTTAPTNNFDNRVINYLHGMQVVLPKLPVGSKATLYIPSGLAFGTQSNSQGSVPIPANANLIYEIELLEIVD